MLSRNIFIVFLVLFSCNTEDESLSSINYTKYIKSLGFSHTGIIKDVDYIGGKGMDMRQFMLGNDTIIMSYIDTTTVTYYDSLKLYVNSIEIKDHALRYIESFTYTTIKRIEGYPEYFMLEIPFGPQGFYLNHSNCILYNYKTNKIIHFDLWFDTSYLFADINKNGKINILKFSEIETLSSMKARTKDGDHKHWHVFDAEILELNHDDTIDSLDHPIRDVLLIYNRTTYKYFLID